MKSIPQLRVPLSFVGALALLAVLAGMNHAQVPATTKALEGKDLENLSTTVEGIAKAATFQLHQGLPHPTWEAEELKKEKATAKHMEMHGFPFYAAPVQVAAAESDELRKLAIMPGTYRPYSGPKRCGGFHPDYALQWKDGEATYEVLVCFGCKEAKLFGPKSELHVDLSEKGGAKLEALLKKHRQPRAARG